MRNGTRRDEICCGCAVQTNDMGLMGRVVVGDKVERSRWHVQVSLTRRVVSCEV